MGRYSSGEWYTLVTNHGVAMLPHNISPEVAESVWLSLGEGGGLAAVLEGIVSGFGASLSALPPFAVVSRTQAGGEVRVAVRGHLAVRAASTAGDVVVDGSGVATWNERGLDTISSVTVGIPGADALRLPINDGVVLAGQIAFTFDAPKTVSAGTKAPLRLQLPDAPQPPAKDPDAAQEAPEKPSIEASILEYPAAESSISGDPAVESPMASLADNAVSAAAEPESMETAPEDPVTDDPSPGDPEPEAEPEGPAPITEGPTPGGETTIEPLVVDPSWEAGSAGEMPAPEDYDRLLYGDTTKRSVEGAAIRANVESPGDFGPLPAGMISGLPRFAGTTMAEPARQDRLGDHDDETVSTAKIQSLLHQAGGQGHGAVHQGPAARRQDAAAVLVVSTGERVMLDRGAVVGRRPQLVRVQGGNVPRLVTVPSPNQDISRSHLELRLVGDDVLAVDLDTKNGTRLLRPGCDPVRLQPGDSTILVAGDRLDMGDGVELGFEGLR